MSAQNECTGLLHKINQTNPLDWQQTDRTILMAFLCLITPFGMGLGLLFCFLLAPEWFNPLILKVSLANFGIHFLALVIIILYGTKVRTSKPTINLSENIVLATYIITVAMMTWFTGTHFSYGMVMNFMGLAIMLPLCDIKKVKICYFTAFSTLPVFAVMEKVPGIDYAPLFSQPPYHEDGSPVFLWYIFQISFAFLTTIYFFTALMSTERWWRREDQLRELACTDGLTRLTNRRHTMERGEAEFAKVLRKPESSKLSCILLDIDHFKAVNDTHGHQAGDAVLVAVAQELAGHARESDETGRYGGEEFLIILPDCDINSAKQVAERLRQAIESTSIQHNGLELKVTSSFGVTTYSPEKNNTFYDMVAAADEALYQAKENGRNCVVIG